MSIKIGQCFEMLHVEHVDKVGKATCVCDCGKSCIVSPKDLRSGNVISCGCKPAKSKVIATKSHGFTAAQITKGELEPLGKQIAAHLGKMRGYEAKAHEKAGVELRKADDHWNTITQLLAEAKAKCDGGGFNAFKEKYCPDLSRSRVYELLAIGSGKKTVEEIRAGKRASVAKSRRKVSATSPPVADRPEVEQVKKTLLESGEVIAAPSATSSDKSEDEDPAVSADAALDRTGPSPRGLDPENEAHVRVDSKKIMELAGQARALLQHPTAPNVESVKRLLTKITGLCTKPSVTRTSEEKKPILDQTLLPKALGLGDTGLAIPDDDLSIPDYLRRTPTPVLTEEKPPVSAEPAAAPRATPTMGSR